MQAFLNRFADEVKPAEFEVALDDVYNIDVSIGTGAGRMQEAPIRTTGELTHSLLLLLTATVFRRNLLCKYQLKAKSSRQVYSEITQQHPTMPFCARSLDSAPSRIAIKVRTPERMPIV